MPIYLEQGKTLRGMEGDIVYPQFIELAHEKEEVLSLVFLYYFYLIYRFPKVQTSILLSFEAFLGHSAGGAPSFWEELSSCF